MGIHVAVWSYKMAVKYWVENNTHMHFWANQIINLGGLKLCSKINSS